MKEKYGAHQPRLVTYYGVFSESGGQPGAERAGSQITMESNHLNVGLQIHVKMMTANCAGYMLYETPRYQAACFLYPKIIGY